MPKPSGNAPSRSAGSKPSIVQVRRAERESREESRMLDRLENHWRDVNPSRFTPTVRKSQWGSTYGMGE